MSNPERPFSHFEADRQSEIRRAVEIIGRHQLLSNDSLVKAMVEADFVDADGNPVEPMDFLVTRFKELQRALNEMGREV